MDIIPLEEEIALFEHELEETKESIHQYGRAMLRLEAKSEGIEARLKTLYALKNIQLHSRSKKELAIA